MLSHNKLPEITFEKVTASIKAGIFDFFCVCIALLDVGGRISYCNKAFLALFGLSGDIKGHCITQYFQTADGESFESWGERKVIVCSVKTSSLVSCTSIRYPLLDVHGRLRGFLFESHPAVLNRERMLSIIESAHSLEAGLYELNYQKQNTRKISELCTFDEIIGNSPSIEQIRSLGSRFAQGNEAILITGESGTGKELVAQSIHMASPRSDRNFVTMNCAAIPQDLIDSELFGYEKGAFTGARSGGLKGKFELADRGTIFLDEIGDLPLGAQAKLLRVLENGEIQKLAQSRNVYSDFRLIGATNKNLLAMVRLGHFREDLFHRLSVFELSLPPLRDRLDDLPMLVRYYCIQILGKERGSKIVLDDQLRDTFMKYPWTGNVRELKNILNYGLYVLDRNEHVITLEHMPKRFLQELQELRDQNENSTPFPPAQAHSQSVGAWRPVGGSFDEVSNQACRIAIEDALKKAKYNKVRAAKTLGISRSKLYRKLREFDMLDESDDTI